MVPRFIKSNIALLCLAALAISIVIKQQHPQVVYHGERSDAAVAIRVCDAGAQ
jgi:hypothetical protein